MDIYGSTKHETPDGTELTLHYIATPWKGMTWYEPGNPGQVTISTISWNGVDVSKSVFKRLMAQHLDEFMETVLNQLM